MSELFAAFSLLLSIGVSAWFFGMMLQAVETQGRSIGYQQGVIDGTSRALNPKNRDGRFVSISIEEEIDE